MNHAFAVGDEVRRCVFGRAIVSIGRGKHRNRWFGAHDIEKGEWRGVDIAGRIHRGHQGDGARDNKPREQLIGPVARVGGDIEPQAHAAGGESSPPCEMIASRRRRSCRYDMIM